MKREILFRGKRVDNKEWIEGDLIRIGETYSIAREAKRFSDYPQRIMVHSDTVDQFTGRVSLEGKKIFQHDIVNVDDSGVGGFPHEMKTGTYIVVWNNIEAMFMLEQFDGLNAICFDEVCLYTVLGNIYDNPELIRKEADNG